MHYFITKLEKNNLDFKIQKYLEVQFYSYELGNIV